MIKEYLEQGYEILLNKESIAGFKRVCGLAKHEGPNNDGDRFCVAYMINGNIYFKTRSDDFKGIDKLVDGGQLLTQKYYERISLRYVKVKDYVYILEINNVIDIPELPIEVREEYVKGGIYVDPIIECGYYNLEIIDKNKILYRIRQGMRYNRKEFDEIIKHLKMAGERLSKLLKKYRTENIQKLEIKEIKI
jgi:hypothetical protein